MKKIAMTKNAYNALAFRVTTIVAALLLVLLPATGFGSFAQMANAGGFSTDTSLSTFTVDEQTVTDGSSIDVDYGTDSVEVVATPTSSEAVVNVTGETDLVSGPNTVTVVVTAEDDVTTQTYTVTVNVTENNDASLGVFSVNGNDVTNGGSVDLPFGTTEVEYVAEATDVEASVVVSLVDELVTGANTLTVTVTAANGTTQATYTVTLNVLENDDASLGVFSINGNDVANGASVDLTYGTTEVEYVAEATDPEAAVVVAVADELVTGSNTFTVTVTAANGTTQDTYTVTLNVAENDDATLGVFSINGTDVTTGGSVDLPFGTTEVEYVAEATDPEAGVVVAVADELATGANTLTVTVTAANGTTTATYTVTLNVAANNDSSLGVFSVNGDDVTTGGTVNLANGVTSVTVIAEPTDTGAVAVVTGATGLSTGTNTLTVVVTAANGTSTTTYTVSLVVASLGGEFSNDTSLSTFKVDGKNAVDGSSFNIALGRTSVTVDAVPTNAYATAVTAGNTNLVLGANTVTVTVTADDGTVKVYTVTVTVAAPSSVKTISTVTVNGTNFTTGFNAESEFDAAFGTTQVTVAVVPTSNLASVVVTNNTGLVAGLNTVNIAVTAEDESVANYTLKVVVAAANTNTNLSLFKVNGDSVVDGSIFELAYGTTAVSVEAEAEAETSTLTVTGNSDLVTGDNTLTVRVVAQSGAARSSTVTLRVLAASSNKTITGVTVNGVAVVDGAVTLPRGITSATVLATLSSAFASYTVSGASALNPGANTVTVTVTAQDGTTADTEITVTVTQPSTVNTLSSITVDEVVVTAGSTVNKANGTESVAVVATPTSNVSTAVVSGNTDLNTGLNTVTITVTAESGAVATYTFTVDVAKSSLKTLSSITVGGETVAAGGTINQPIGTTQVTVVATPTSSVATAAVTGNTGLSAGANVVTVTVTAEDLTTAEYTFTVNVAAANTNTALSLFKVNGTDVLELSSLDLAFGTTAVSVEAAAEAGTSTFTVSGTSGLQAGANTLTVTVTAQSGAVQSFTKTLNVLAASSNKTITGVTVNGVAVVDGAVTLPRGITSATVLATLSSAFASYTVSGASALNPGANTVTVTVTAQDGTTADTEITVTVTQPSTVNTLSSITVDEVVVTAGSTVNKANGTESVAVVATPTSNVSTAVVSGNTDLNTGLNTVTITVTAESGAVATYTFTVDVAKSSLKTLSSITVGGETVAAGGTIDLSAGTTSVNVLALATSPEATVSVSGDTNLVAGPNTVTVTVTAEDLTTAEYTFTANVLSLSKVTSLAVFTVNGQNALTNQTINVGNEVTEAFVLAQTTSSAATYQVTSGTALTTPGSYTITVVVTAEDTNFTRTYDVTVVRAAALSDNANLGSIKIGETDVEVGSDYEVPAGTTQVDVVATAESEAATVSVSGNTGLKTGTNVVTVFVTAENARVASYTFNVVVALSNNADLTAITVNGTSVSLSDLVFNVPAVTTSVVVSATTSDVDATFAVTGQDSLETGDNEVVITVTAANLTTTREYKLNVVRAALSSNTDLGVVTLNGEEVEAGANVEVPFGTTEVFVTATTADTESNAVVTGTSPLATGANTVTIVVSAPSGATESYTITVTVRAQSNDTSLAVFTVDGEAVTDAANITLDGTKNFVSVVAQATDAGATVSVTGTTDLVYGENQVKVTVTAEDGTVEVFTIFVTFPNLTDTTLETFTIDGSDVADGDVIELESGVTDVEVVAVPTDSNANAEIEGGAGLEPGENTVTVTVTAADGETVKVYTVTLNVAFSGDNTLSEFTLNGEAIEDGASVELAPYTTEVEVVAVPTDENAEVDIVGADALEPGENTIEVTVTAANGDTAVYSIFVTVLLSAETGVTEILVGGESVIDGDVVLITDLETTEVDVEVTTVDENATFDVTGNTDLLPGDNEITILVTAPNSDTREYKITYRIGGLAGNAKLESLSVGGLGLNLAGETLSVSLAAGSKSTPVIAIAQDQNAQVKVVGNKALVAGANTVTITVTGADGSTERIYTVTVNVAALSSNKQLDTLSVNGTAVSAGSSITLAAGATFAELKATPDDEKATVRYSGNKNLIVGNNTATVYVTAADGSTAEYTVTLVVPALSSDKSLSSFKIQGFNVLGKSKINVLPGTTKLHVSAIANAAGASVTITGRDIQAGLNDVVVTVTAADGTSQTYTVKVKA